MKQKTIAGVCGGGRVIIGRRFVQLTENADIAAVVDLVQKRAVASSDIGGTQHQEFGAEFHQSVIVARRQLEIGNRSIRRSVRIKREEGATAQLFTARLKRRAAIPSPGSARDRGRSQRQPARARHVSNPLQSN